MWNVPPSHFLCVVRVWIVGLLCVNVAKEYYEWMKGKSNSPKFALFLFGGILLMELLLVLSQGKGMFEHAYLDTLGWVMMLGLGCMFMVLMMKIGISDMIRGVKLVKGNI